MKTATADEPERRASVSWSGTNLTEPHHFCAVTYHCSGEPTIEVSGLILDLGGAE